ncbi:unnamed protein product [Symbiodinium microadriaticum]|nr:unnamed protein product [Symbiodinium microadriaticum]
MFMDWRRDCDCQGRALEPVRAKGASDHEHRRVVRQELEWLPESGCGFPSPSHFQKPGDSSALRLLLELPRRMKAVEQVGLDTETCQFSGPGQAVDGLLAHGLTDKSVSVAPSRSKRLSWVMGEVVSTFRRYGDRASAAVWAYAVVQAFVWNAVRGRCHHLIPLMLRCHEPKWCCGWSRSVLDPANDLHDGAGWTPPPLGDPFGPLALGTFLAGVALWEVKTALPDASGTTDYEEGRVSPVIFSPLGALGCAAFIYDSKLQFVKPGDDLVEYLKKCAPITYEGVGKIASSYGGLRVAP